MFQSRLVQSVWVFVRHVQCDVIVNFISVALSTTWRQQEAQPPGPSTWSVGRSASVETEQNSSWWRHDVIDNAAYNNVRLDIKQIEYMYSTWIRAEWFSVFLHKLFVQDGIALFFVCCLPRCSIAQCDVIVDDARWRDAGVARSAGCDLTIADARWRLVGVAPR